MPPWYRSSSGFNHVCGVGVGEQSIGFHHLPDEDVTIPTPDPEPSQTPSPLCTERMPEATADREPAAMYKPDKRTEPTITLDPEHHSDSDQVCEPATLSFPVGLLVVYEGMKESLHCTATEGELQLASEEVYHYEEMEEVISLSLPSQLVLPSFSRLTPLCSVDPPQAFQSPAPPQQKDALAPPPATGPITYLGSAINWLHLGSSLPRLHLGPPPLRLHWVSVVPPAPPWSDVTLPMPRTSGSPATPRPSTPSALSCSTFPLAPP